MTQPSRRKGGLGRGLASLIPTGPADTESDASRLGPRMGAAAADVLLGGGPADGPAGSTGNRSRPHRAEPAPTAAGVRRRGPGRTRAFDP